MAIPAAREPGPLVTVVRNRPVANVDSIVILSSLAENRCDLGVCFVEDVYGAAV
jgi:hypothetical protein